MKDNNEVKVFANGHDLRQLSFFMILSVIAQVFLLFVLSWNIVAIVVCAILSIVILIFGFVDWLYFNRTVILDKYGCTFVSFLSQKKFSWDDIYLLQTENSSFFFGDSEIPGEGIILSAKPILKPLHIGAMTYCRFTHPSISVFIRFISPLEQLNKTTAKFIYTGFVVEKEEILSLL